MKSPTATERDLKVAYDIAGTILHYRQNGCFATKELMRGAIQTETNLHAVDHKEYVRLMAEDFIAQHNEWFDRECEPDEN